MSDSGICGVGVTQSSVLDPDLIDDLAAHLPAAQQIDKAALLPGMYLAWCVRLNLISQQFAREHTEHVLRLNYGDCNGSEVLVAACGGSLRYSALNERGAAFTRDHYASYLADWRDTFGEDVYGVADNWESYQQIAALLTRRLMGEPSARAGDPSAPASRRWWQFWK